MRNIVYISSFDPINNLNIKDIKSFDNKNTKFYLVLPYSKYCSFNDRIKMIEIALNGLDINYEIDASISEKYLNSIDLVKLFKKYKNNGVNDLFLLVHDEEPVLISEDKIIAIKAKLNLIDNNVNLSHNIRVLKSIDTTEEIIDYIIQKNLYFMEIIRQYINGHRLNHSISVAKTAYKIALSNELSRPDEYFIAGLLHDIGKHVNEEEARNYMEKYFRSYINLPSWSYHQFIGAFLAKKLFPNISDDVYKAILTHCTGDENMRPMQKVIYASDKIEPTRGYDSESMINHCNTNYKEGFIEVLSENMKFLSENGGVPSDNELTKRCLECYLNNNCKGR